MTANANDHQLRITRRIEATPEEVFDAWTDAESIGQWMVPAKTGFKPARATMDVRVGGRYQIDMISETKVYPHTGEYLRIDRPRLLEFTWISEGTEQQRTIVTVELRPAGGATDLTLTHRLLSTEENAKDHTEGWTEIVEKLAARFANAA